MNFVLEVIRRVAIMFLRFRFVVRFSITDVKMVVEKMLMAISISVIMFVRNIVLVKGLFVKREVSPGVVKNMRSGRSTF